MPRRHWFLPDSPDLLGMLQRQLVVTVQGMDAFAAWAAGDAGAADRTRALEHEADGLKRELKLALREAFTTPMGPEDLFALSHGVDWVLNYAKDVIGESEVMACPPDEAIAEMARLLADAVRDIREAIARLGSTPGDPVDAAEAAVKAERSVEKVYRRAMAALLEEEDLREVIARRELYRRCSRIGEVIVDVAERVGYAIAKES
ncbi:MAG TPA: DUF47 family protein [Solirubrobacteraceae bacterium]|nr:DUF47 family protein [Solirubrobacteraceae bacterium]